eukprot:scaffold22023_cov41-Phaeocystis_antarctica.AAC.1
MQARHGAIGARQSIGCEDVVDLRPTRLLSGVHVSAGLAASGLVFGAVDGLGRVFDCGDVGRLRGPAAQERELEHLIEPYAQHLDASSRTRATRPSLQNLVRLWALRPPMRPCVPPAVRGNHALAETMIMENVGRASKEGPSRSVLRSTRRACNVNLWPVQVSGGHSDSASRYAEEQKRARAHVAPTRATRGDAWRSSCE